jgi:hypothetical protein
MRKYGSFLLVVVLSTVFLSGCFGPTDTQEDQAIVITKSGKIQEIKIGGGRHTSLTPYVGGTVIGLGIREAVFITDGENGKAWTKDSQPVIITIALEYRINSTNEAIEWLWTNKKVLLESDDAKYEAVRARLLSQLKEVTVRYTLFEMVGIKEDAEEQTLGRERVVEDLFSELAPELALIQLELISINILNVDPADDEFEALMNEAAKAKAREKAANDNLAVKRKEQESARIDNEIAKEKAENDADIRQIDAKIWEDDRAYQLELTRLVSDALNKGDVIVFVPEGEDITYILNGSTGEVVPVQ